MLFPSFKYAIDTCSFTALYRTYPPDVFPTAWEKIDKLIRNGIICSCEDVLQEIVVQDDVLSKWAKERQNIFLPIDAQVQEYVIKILTSHPNLLNLKKGKSGADPFLISVALIHKCSLVTEELPSGGPQRSKIPDVCIAYSIEYIRLLEMMRREGIKL